MGISFICVRTGSMAMTISLLTVRALPLTWIHNIWVGGKCDFVYASQIDPLSLRILEPEGCVE